MLTEPAHKNLEEMFPHRASPLAQTDPDLAVLRANPAFNETWEEQVIDCRSRADLLAANRFGARVARGGIDLRTRRTARTTSSTCPAVTSLRACWPI